MRGGATFRPVLARLEQAARCHAPTLAVSCKPNRAGALHFTGYAVSRRLRPVHRVEGVGRNVTEEEMRKRLAALRIEHRDLDAAIDALSLNGARDQLQIARLKKRKLLLKDQIAMIEDYLIPDIIA